jgi:hypothetical protein
MGVVTKARFITGPNARALAWTSVLPGSGCPTPDDRDLVYAMIRIAAARTGPCTRPLLAGAVVSALRGLVSGEVSAPTRVDAAVDDLIMTGDLITASDGDGPGRRLIFLGPPMYVRRRSGAVFIMGGTGEADPSIGGATRCRGPVRELEPPPPDEVLTDSGFTPYPVDAWIESPSGLGAADVIGELDRLLDAAPPSGEVAEVEIIDPDARTDYYRGRWSTPRRQTGRHIMRRKLRWGGRGWGYAELIAGSVARYVALPAVDRRFRPCDEAWWALCASDSMRGSPQALLVGEGDGLVRLGFQMPLPMWAERRLMMFGSPSPDRPRGAMMAYDVPGAEAAEEIAFLTERLWLRVRREPA